MKLAPHRVGPFKILKIINKVAIQLEIPNCWGKHNVFHISHLTLYHGRNPILTDQELEASLEK